MINQRNKEQKRKSGFTLLEIIVSIAVLGILIGASVTIFTTISRSSFQARTRQDMTNIGYKLMDLMASTIRNGSVVVANACGSGYSSTMIVTNPTDSLEYLSNGSCAKTVFSLSVGVNGNGVISKTYRNANDTNCVSGIGAGSISDDAGRNAVDVYSLGFCQRITAGNPTSVDINITLSPNKAIFPILPQNINMRVNLTSTVAQRIYN